MASHNPFFPQDRELFAECYECWYCHRNTPDCLHHIVGRGSGASVCESSILNAAPLCNQRCHIPNHGLISTKEWKRKLLNKTYSFLESTGYVFKENDLAFLEKYADLY